jgi:hypothetical protein
MFGALYFILNVKFLKSLPTCFYILVINFNNFFICAILAKITSQMEINAGSSTHLVEIFSFDPYYGCFGFLHKDHLFINLFLNGFLASLCGSAGYIVSLLFFTPVVTTNAFLVEPFLAQMLGYLTGLDNLPGAMTLIGAVVTVTSIFMIDKGGRLRN